jgi:hypothetical protein
MTNIKYPNVFVDLSRVDGNAFSIIAAVSRAMKRNGIPASEVDAYRKEATSDDYNHLLMVTTEWVSVDYADDGNDQMTDEEHDAMFEDYNENVWYGR